MNMATRTRKILQLEDEILAIKAQLAAADLNRQGTGRPIDPRWHHRARTALRHKRKALARLQQRNPDKSRFKDMLIALLRDATPEADWTAFLEEAKRRTA
ncbi:MAG: hypothetical protein PsegKO_34820 [Pseudohongiellaceae bacterium]